MLHTIYLENILRFVGHTWMKKFKSLLRWISNFRGSNTMADFDPVLACKSSMANPASNPATFLHVFSVGFTYRFGSEILVQKCPVFAYVFWFAYLGLKTGVQDLSIQKGFPAVF